MKHLPLKLVLICAALTTTLSLVADNLWDVVEDAQNAILQKYPSETSIARSMALDELRRIAGSDKTDEEKIVEIRAKYPTSILSLPIPSESVP